MRSLFPLSLVVAAALLGGCKSTSEAMINKATDTPEFAKNILDKTTSSCVDAANKQIPTKTPQTDALVNKYCGCVGRQVGTNFSHAQLVELGLQGGTMSPEVQGKMNTIVASCQTEAGIK